MSLSTDEGIVFLGADRAFALGLERAAVERAMGVDRGPSRE
jgi:hypothetical protein